MEGRSCADLELSIRRHGVGTYRADARFRAPDSPTDDDLATGASVAFDLRRLHDSSVDADEYGRALTSMFFADQALRRAWTATRASALSAGTPLRIRLRVESSAADLHAVAWELLRDPDIDGAMLPSEHVRFSRYLAGEGLSPVELREFGELRALAIVAAPSDVSTYNLATIDGPGEIERARAALGTFPVDVLGAGAGYATLEDMVTALRDGPDILYLVAHGTMRDGEPYLWLETREGTSHRVSGSELARRLRYLERRPALVVLASCRSAGDGTDHALTALGPRLVKAGVPAVIAMQGDLSMVTAARLLPVFFRELSRDGTVDRALSAGRSSVLDRRDWWIPVLFTRLRDVCIWDQPRIVDESDYDVHGLANPYLGLRPFTYSDRDRYAGRDHETNEGVTKLATPGTQRSLIFVTGASGSGKSSFAQAGLLPALEDHYQQRHQVVRRAVMRPGVHPLAAMADALLQLRLPPDDAFAATRPFMVGVPAGVPDQNTIGLLIIDQFEELFLPQCDAAQRDGLFAVLASLPPFPQLRVHLIATMRADFLPELFQHQALYEVAKQGIDLRAMAVSELQEAILRPLQRAHPTKRIEPALLERLAADAAASAAYLPLLQVTLDDLWRRGSLRLASYGTLTDAIRRRADEVFEFADYDGDRRSARTDNERAEILNVFLDLVEVSLDDDPRRDVRVRRDARDLTRDNPERLRLIDDLCRARLLSLDFAR